MPCTRLSCPTPRETSERCGGRVPRQVSGRRRESYTLDLAQFYELALLGEGPEAEFGAS